MATEEQSSKDALRTANAYAQATLALVADVRRRNPDLADRMRRGTRRAADFSVRDLEHAREQFGREEINRDHLIILTAEAVRIWQQHRIVYRLHPEMATGLIGTDATTKIPCEVLRRLPHPDPFIVFPSPIPDQIPDRGFPVVPGTAEIIGVMVTGFAEDDSMCSTLDPRLALLNVAVAGRLQYVGQHVTYEEHSVHIPLTGVRSPLEMATAMKVKAGSRSGPAADNLAAYQLAISILLYLCSERADIRREGPTATRTRPREKTGAAVVVDIGFDIGPKLLAARRAAEDDPHGSRETSGSPRRSHWRRAHFHTYLIGSRAKPTPVLRWISPILVNPADRPDDRASVIDASSTSRA